MDAPRIKCPTCEKDYANRKSLKKHLLGVHEEKFNYRLNTTRKLQGTELVEAVKILRNKQRSKRYRTKPIVKPSKQRCMSRARSRPRRSIKAPETLQRDSTNVILPPVLPFFPSVNLSDAQLPDVLDELSVNTDDIDPAILDLSLSRAVSASASVSSMPAFSSFFGTSSQRSSRVASPCHLRTLSRSSGSSTVIYDLHDRNGAGPLAPDEAGPLLSEDTPRVSDESSVPDGSSTPVYNREKMGACAHLLLNQFLRSPASVLLQHLLQRLHPSPPPQELACVADVFHDVEMGQRLLSNYLLRAVTTEDMSTLSACQNLILRMCHHFGDLRNRPSIDMLTDQQTESAESELYESESEVSNSAMHYSDVSQ